MAITARLDLSVWRNDETYEFVLRVIGPDLRGVDLRAQIRLAGDTPGAPLANLTLVANGNAEGVRLAGTSVGDNGFVNDVRIRLNKSTRQAFPYAGEAGEAARLAWGFQIAGITRIEGAVYLPAQVYGSDNAPAGRVGGYNAGATPPSSSGATLTIAADNGAILSIDGADLVGVLTDRAEAAAARATSVAPQIVPQSTATVAANAAGGTRYALALPAAFLPLPDGGYVDFQVPATNLGPVKLTIDGVTRDLFMVVGQPLRAGWTVRIMRNDPGAVWTFVRQTPIATDFLAVEETVQAVGPALDMAIGVMPARLIGGNPDDIYVPFDGWANDAVFEALILETNKTNNPIITVPNHRVELRDAPAGSLVKGQIARFVVSAGVNAIFLRGSRPLLQLSNLGGAAPESWDAVSDLVYAPYGDVALGAGGKPAFTKRTIRSVGRGSSVATDPNSDRNGAAPAGQTPLQYLADTFAASFGPYIAIKADNWSHGGHVASHGDGQWAEAMAQSPAVPSILMDCWGMNDLSPSAYNSGQTVEYLRNPIYYEAELRRRSANGVKMIVLCTTPHPHTGRYNYALDNGVPMTWPYNKAAPVAPDEIVPPAALSTADRDWTGGGVIRRGDTRAGHVNIMIRNVARRLHLDPGVAARIVLLDVEWAWFRYGAEAYGLDQLYNAGEIVHPNLLGHQVSYQRCIRELVIAMRRGRGDQWTFRGEA